MSRVDVICPICQIVHAMIGTEWIDTEGTRHIMAKGDPFCSDECRASYQKEEASR